MPDFLAPDAPLALHQNDYLDMDATDMAAAVSMGELEPAALLGAALARCDAVAPVVGAVNMRHDAFAREQLRELMGSGRLRTAPLAGVPMLIKDMNTYLGGTVTTNGSRFLAGSEVAAHTSTIVQRYQEAGMLVFGKTTTPEFGLATTTESALWGQTRNPWSLGHSVGG